LVKNLGGEIIVKSTTETGDQTEDGAIEVRKEQEFTIYLSPFTGPLRDRFTIAHELGHYFLHSKVGKKRIRVPRAGGGREEWEANWFAAGFLMPEEMFRKEWGNCHGNCHGNIGMIASKFAVSTFTTRRRAQELGLISDTPVKA
jgi:Zn-dependent peptidase ImmA (M78 family)